MKQESIRVSYHARYAMPAAILAVPLLLLALSVAGGRAGAATAPKAPEEPESSCGLAWRQVGLPAVPPSNALNDIVAVSADNVWAVGTQPSQQPLIERWNGSAWSIVPAPGAQNSNNTLVSISALTASDIWAVGWSRDNSEIDHTLTLHWDGSAWQSVTSPDAGGAPSRLNDVKSVAASDAWAVGESLPGGVSHNLAMHWDGTAWTIVAAPGGVSVNNALKAVTGSGSNDMWAAGYSNGTSPGHGFTLHWNGTIWSIVSMPQPGQSTILNDIESVTSGDVWAVGSYSDTAAHSLAIHWNGQQWAAVSTPSGAVLEKMAVISPSNIWAVGGTAPTALEWNGQAWNTVPGPPLNGNSFVGGASAVSPSDLWVAGSERDANNLNARVYRHSDRTFDFADISEGSTFFPFVKCLVCQNIISGYACGGPVEPCDPNNDPYFRPNVPVTRGQLAKIIATSIGATGTPATQTFEDVPPGSTFYAWVENLATRGILGGYACGAPGEPCLPPGNRPYFRPNSTATRGQLSKIVAQAAGFNDPIPAGRQTFADLAPASTFYTYTERLLINRPGVVSGYPCGGAAEPCDPQSRPYFRPNNNVTRGQTVKIASNTFFPDCNIPKR